MYPVTILYSELLPVLGPYECSVYMKHLLLRIRIHVLRYSIRVLVLTSNPYLQYGPMSDEYCRRRWIAKMAAVSDGGLRWRQKWSFLW